MLAAMGMTDIHAMNKLKVLAWRRDQWSCGGDVCNYAGDILAAGAGDDSGVAHRRTLERALCAEAAAVVDSRVCDFGWERA